MAKFKFACHLYTWLSLTDAHLAPVWRAGRLGEGDQRVEPRFAWACPSMLIWLGE